MPTTIIGAPLAPSFPSGFAAPIIETAATWDDDWKFDPELTLVSCHVCASSSAISTCEFSRRYNQANIKFPHESDMSAKSAKDLTEYWIRLSIMGNTGPMPVFVGQVDNSARKLMGSDSAAAGTQNWVASGGMRILHKQMIAGAVFLNSTGQIAEVGWIPAMNGRDHRGLLVGNRSDAKPGASDAKATDREQYYYGGKGVWTHLQYLYYLIDNFIQQDGPTWTVGGQAAILDTMQTTIVFGEVTTAAEALKHLIPVSYGVDYYIKPTADGFEICVFALSGDEASFTVAAPPVDKDPSSPAASALSITTVTMPKNPNLVKIERTTDANLIETHLVASTERRVDRIEVIGKRIVVCGTLRADAGSLVPKWSNSLEQDYITAGGTVVVGTTDASDSDKIRRREKYRAVYQHLGAPDNWDMAGGKWCLISNDDGSLYTGGAPTPPDGDNPDGEPGTLQTAVRQTMHWIPLKEGFDYTTDPPKDNTAANVEPDVKPPLAWLHDAQAVNATSGATAPGYVQADLVGIHVAVPFMDWGVFLHASPNHRMAYSSWTAAQQDTTEMLWTERVYDYHQVVATIAIESDHRLRLGYNVPADQAAGDGSVMSIHDSEAECWVLLANTIVDVGTDGTLADSGDKQRILRNDAGRLGLVLAGAIARYGNERGRAHLVWKGFQPWGGLIGSILSVIQQGDDIARVGAPITSVEWILGNSPTTIVKTGYA